ncbi:non-canonical purine NTP pyrophosphatase, partial [Pseudomonas aeruginosa]|nr:non-canonical purine NTP pyrophosphatase [Pseudomonas aeruginosa]
MIKLEQLVLASHNAGKLKELQAMLGASVKAVSYTHLTLPTN